MDTTNALSEEKLIEQMVTPAKMSPAFVSASEISSGEKQLNEELEYLWEDCDLSGKSYAMYLGKISRNPIVKSMITGKYFALPWSEIIKLAVAKAIDK